MEDRSFVPDGLVPGLRTAPPQPRGRDIPAHFNEGLDESMHYNLQRLAQQQHQGRNIDPTFSASGNHLLNQQLSRHGGNLPLQTLQQPLQQPLYRGGPSPLNQHNPTQRLPPGLANLGGRPPHDPNQFGGLSGPQHNIHNNGHLPPQHPFNFNHQSRGGPIPASLLQNTGGQQIPLGNLGHPNLDPRLSNHHQLMGLGGSGMGSRINGGFPPQQGTAVPNHLGMRPQQQQPNLLPHLLPHLMPPHLQPQGHSPSNSPQNQELMALLMGGHHRE